MLNIKEILNGWENYFIPNPVTEEEAKRRAEICLSCPSLKKGKVLAFLKDKKITEIEGTYCGECGCPSVAGVRSKDKKCDLKKW